MRHGFRSLMFMVLVGLGAGGAILFGCVQYLSTTLAIERHIDAQLDRSVDSLVTMVDTVARMALRSRLQVVAEQSRDRAREMLRAGEAAGRDRATIIAEIETMLNRQRIGESGYIYCLDSGGTVRVHPDQEVVGSQPLDQDFIGRQLDMKDGYLEYTWQNPDDPTPRLKALSMSFLPELDWIITASAYRNEVRSLIDVAGFRESVSAMTVGEASYPFIIDYAGETIVHPTSDRSAGDLLRDRPQLFATLMARPNGRVSYTWADGRDARPRRKIAAFRHIPDLEWVVCATISLDEAYAPLRAIRWQLLLVVGVVVAAAALFAAWLSRRLSRPLSALVEAFEHDAAIEDMPAITTGPVEYQRLAEHYQQSIARQRGQEDEVRRSRRMLQAVLDAIPVGVFWCEPKGLLLGCNQQFATNQGVSLPVQPPLSLASLAWGETGSEVTDLLREVFASGEPIIDQELEVRQASGALQILRMGLVPMRGRNGVVIGALGIYEDMTDQRALEDKLQRAHRLEAIGQLAAGIAHDFNNALTGVVGAAELLSLQLEDDGNRRLCHNILTAADNAAGLTANLLAFARRNPSSAKSISLHRVINEVTAILGHTIDPRIELVSELQAEQHVILGDASQLQSSLLNLGINARDALPKGGRITYSTRETVFDDDDCAASSFDVQPGRYIVCEVADTGIGMPASLLSRIFEPYFTTKEGGKGSGLGLAAVFGTVSSHGGAIEVESSEGAGTVFRLFLPLLSPEESAERRVPSVELHLQGTALLIDDDQLVRETAALLLGRLGFMVTKASSGQEAVAAVRQEGAAFDLVLLDMLMPDQQGPEVLRMLRDEGLDAPVLLISGYTSESSLDEAIAQGAAGFLHKPFRKDTLAAAIQGILGRGPT